MKKIKIEEMSMEERNEVCELLATWLEPYTQEVIVRVMERREEIINNEFAMMLLKQLKEREEKEQERFLDNMKSLFNYFDDHKDYNPHNHPLEHSNSYRDVLYDMYIRG